MTEGAIRLGHLPDSSLSARKIEDAHFCLVASPDYLRRMGTPEQLEDLARHQCLSFVMPSTGRDALKGGVKHRFAIDNTSQA